MTKSFPVGHLMGLFCALSFLGTPAEALDCKKAVSPTDKAICEDPQASAADEAMGRAYGALLASLAEADKKQLLISQRQWLKERGNLCNEEKGPSPSCLVEWSQRRTAFLQGRPETGRGTGHELAPVIIARNATPRTYELDVAVLKFKAPVLPGEKQFNGAVDRLLKDAPSKKDPDDQRDMTYTYDLDLRLAYASPGFLSAHMQNYIFSGGAHGSSGTNNINIDVAKGTTVRFTDVFLPDAQKRLADICAVQIKAQRKEKGLNDGEGLYTGDELQKIITEDVGKLDRWSFSDTKAVVTFDPYEVGSYAEGAYQCTFTSDVLHPLYKPNSIMP